METKLEQQANQLWESYSPRFSQKQATRFWKAYNAAISKAKQTPVQVTDYQQAAVYPSVAKAYKKLPKTKFELYEKDTSIIWGSIIGGLLLSVMITAFFGMIFQHFYWELLLGGWVMLTIISLRSTSDTNIDQVPPSYMFELYPDYFTIHKIIPEEFGGDETAKIYYGNVTKLRFEKHQLTIYEYFKQHGKDKDQLPLYDKNGDKISATDINTLRRFFATVVEERKIGGLIKK